jgi:hypothetical protein
MAPMLTASGGVELQLPQKWQSRFLPSRLTFNSPFMASFFQNVERQKSKH